VGIVDGLPSRLVDTGQLGQRHADVGGGDIVDRLKQQQ